MIEVEGFAGSGIREKKFLVTGAAGFIGSQLVMFLLKQGASQVIALDFSETSTHSLFQGVSSDSLIHVKYCLGSNNSENWQCLLKGIDAVFHLAAIKHSDFEDSFYQIIQSNVLGTAEIVDLCLRQGVKKLIFSSSLYAYGRTNRPEFSENEELNPKTIYGESKLSCERLIKQASEKYGLRITILRYFFVYGPYQLPKHGYPSIVMKNFSRILKNEAPIICGDGLQELDYVFVEDVLKATAGAICKKADGKCYNVGSGHAYSILQLTDEMLKIANSKINPIFVAPDRTAGTSRIADISKISAELGWIPRVNLSQGLSETLLYIKRKQLN